MRNSKLFTATVVALSLALGGCASSLTGDTYSRDEARKVQTVRMGTIEMLRPVKIEGTKTPIGAGAGAVIGGTSLNGGAGRITGTVIGVIILGVMTSGFTFLRIDAYYQEIVKGVIIVAAVVADQYRQRNRRSA